MAEFIEEDQEIEGELHETEPEITVEQRARALGWKPRDTHSGDPRKFLTAEEFIARGEEELPILRDNIRRSSERLVRQDNEIATLKAAMEEQASAVQAAVQMARNASEAGYRRAIRELEAKRRDAAQTGDMVSYDQIGDQIAAAVKERDTEADTANHVTVKVPTVSKAQDAPQQDPETVQFLSENPWFREKPILARAMQDAHQAIINKEGAARGAALAEQYERAKAEVVESFPQFFPKEPAPVADEPPAPPAQQRPRPRLSPALSPNNERPRGKVSPFDVIEDAAQREDAKKAFAGIQRSGSDLTEQEYMDMYLHGTSVLDIRAKRKAN